ncbi:MAG: hypothetical protein LBQ49_01405 [Rickettsiales bacterium]|jgi:hypothetical protein|nr:hypothetical protein [Rickettsiales bacterium]
MKSRFVYISGGADASPAEIKSALDDMRKTLCLPSDVVLFGLPIEGDEAAVAAPVIDVKSRKVAQVGAVQKKSSILSVIKNPDEEEISIPSDLLAANGGEAAQESSRSITDLMGEMPGMEEDEEPKKQGLVEEFGDFLVKEVEPAESKKSGKAPKPFGRKGRGLNNLLGDLFSYAGMAANDDVQDFVLPDFIKRP